MQEASCSLNFIYKLYRFNRQYLFSVLGERFRRRSTGMKNSTAYQPLAKVTGIRCRGLAENKATGANLNRVQAAGMTKFRFDLHKGVWRLESASSPGIAAAGLAICKTGVWIFFGFRAFMKRERMRDRLSGGADLKMTSSESARHERQKSPG